MGRIPAEAAQFRHRAEAALLDGPSAIQVLAGPSGTGKTQLAAHIARRALRDGSADLVVWVTAGSEDALVCGYADAAAATTDHDPGQPERSAEAFRSWLSWTDRRWLVVLDGVPDTAHLHGLWPPARPNGRVLVTARLATSLPGGSGYVEIGPYLPDEAADQLTRELLSHGHRDDPVDIAALAADLRQNPLALSTAAACMAHSGLACAAYRGRLARLAGSDGAGPTRNAVIAGWWVAVETADRQCAGLARPPARTGRRTRSARRPGHGTHQSSRTTPSRAPTRAASCGGSPCRRGPGRSGHPRRPAPPAPGGARQ
ncbi:NB-ARC domain-containing protein [Streptomyces mirabilis]|uniref:NB-ARC domain-containing protein n=1 Tax=Streptomyces mirabilis TaxID=68239 RepID=UPI003677135A